MKLKYTNLDYDLINCNLKSGTFITISGENSIFRLKNTANIKSIRVTDCAEYGGVGVYNIVFINSNPEEIGQSTYFPYSVVNQVTEETTNFTDKQLALDLVNQLLNSQITSITDKFSKGEILFLHPELIELEVLSSDIILGDMLTIPDEEVDYMITNWKGVNKVWINQINSGTCSNSDFSITTSVRTSGSGSGILGELTKIYYGVTFNNEPLYEDRSERNICVLINKYLSDHLDSIRTNGLTFTGNFRVIMLIEEGSYSVEAEPVNPKSDPELSDPEPEGPDNNNDNEL